jgi:hypothetical protein
MAAVNQVRYRRVSTNEGSVDEVGVTISLLTFVFSYVKICILQGEKKKQRAELIEKIVTKLQVI